MADVIHGERGDDLIYEWGRRVLGVFADLKVDLFFGKRGEGANIIVNAVERGANRERAIFAELTTIKYLQGLSFRSWMIGTSGTLTSHKSRAALSSFLDAPSSLANSTWSKSVPSLLQETTPCVSKRTPRVLQVLYPLEVLGVVLWSKCFRDDDWMILGGMSQFFHSSDSLWLYNHPPLVSSCRCFAASSDHFQSLGASI